ncbi:TIGR00255 family protein [Halobacillus alkaliphilus]|uniref:TIGR00255 family protein n=1 Tax=Halobacillus alkaliphilus TaxID=396056 RepID=A0A1I2QCA7_9BACI|nr:YicC/YloC family endoribonuclease [Halobacillus alkaliphilus]SFG23406.1 TIGR00255 family protein [Halobacillus alkaliphilus]
MVNSMTGYGKSSAEVGGSRVLIELRSVNHRYLDISPKMPRTLLFLEEKLKKTVRDKLERGRVDLFISLEGQRLFEKRVSVDWNVLDQYINRLHEVKGRYDLTGDISIDMVSKLDDVFFTEDMEDDTSELQRSLLSTLDHALDQLIIMRENEGERLSEDLQARVSSVSQLLEKLESRRPVVVNEYKDRIRTRIEDYVKEEIQPDDARILQEVGLLAEKGDVTEEFTRLRSHIFQFTNTLEQAGSVGRRLDFIVQEMHREVNTIGSKSNDSKVTEWVIELKSEIEKMKEQVQNVE